MNRFIILLAALSLQAVAIGSATAQQIAVQLSTRETYVDSPITLTLQAAVDDEYELPATPVIDGCQIRRYGAPRTIRQTTNLNGRVTRMNIVSITYTITPEREGTFELPPLEMKVGGKTLRTEAQRFVASKSETGDLLFVEVEGGASQVYVGQALVQTLKIWIKPYIDRENNIKLDAGNMWNTVSQQTNWGSFGDRMQELDSLGQRPGGREVLRIDDDGNERAYYLYEIDATLYPRRPGKIDAGDLRVVVNYPTEIGHARDPFDSMFRGGPFGGSRLSQLMDEDGFASPFRNRLAVTAVRPISAQASVDETTILPIPTEGRPEGYRGAVGSYRILTEAGPKSVNAGDPIELRIGIFGDGPMELVQSPPLAQLTSLTDGFKVADDSPGGFVHDDSKVFLTTVRPRNESITEIPPIPFSFFHPQTKSYKTVYSEPIPITVAKGEVLAFDQIVSNHQAAEDGAPSNVVLQPNFDNSDSASVLESQRFDTPASGWLALIVVPALVWLVTFLAVRTSVFRTVWASLRSCILSERTRCQSDLERAQSLADIETALVRFIANGLERKQLRCMQSAIGALRLAGFRELALAFETEWNACTRRHSGIAEHVDLSSSRQRLFHLVDRLDSGLRRNRKSDVRPALSTSRKPADKSTNPAPAQGLLVLLALGLQSIAPETLHAESTTPQHSHSIELTSEQQQVILDEATQTYRQAVAVIETDRAEANELLSTAMAKYQLLIDAGVHSAQLFQNQGNACFQSGRLGAAIANYQNGLVLNPLNRQLKTNLDAVMAVVESKRSGELEPPLEKRANVLDVVSYFNQALLAATGRTVMLGLLALSSLLFWALLFVWIFRPTFPVRILAIGPFILLAVSAISLWLASETKHSNFQAVLVSKQVVLHSGDGQEFDRVAEIASADGVQVNILEQRSGWLQIETAQNQQGWIPREDAIQFWQ